MKYVMILLTIFITAVATATKAPNKSVAPYVRVTFIGAEFRARVTGSESIVYSPEPAVAVDGQLIQVVEVPREAPVCIELEEWVVCTARKSLPEDHKGIEL